MLLDISKLLLLITQIITTTSLINIILLTTCCSTVNTLPITSKPIESTAENLAWEAWLMVPVGQQVKTRKVTPKSIFIVPPKTNQTTTCPPGEHWSKNTCIPTVKIDTDKALLNQLSNLAPLSEDYDYDYEEADNQSPGTEKLEGSADTNPFTIGNFADEPLKFNIFSETFPIGGSSGSGDSSGLKDTEDDNVFYVTERRRRPPTPPELDLPDLEQSSPVDDGKNPEEGSALFLSGIDAILVPAVSESQGNEQNMSFSIYQQGLNTTEAQKKRIQEIEEILEDELLILPKIGTRVNATTSPTPTESNHSKSGSPMAPWETTTTTKLDEEYEDGEGKTEFTRSVTDLPPIVEETSQPTNFAASSTMDVSKVDTTTISDKIDDITTIATSPKEEPTTIQITTTSKETEISTISTMPNEDDATTIFVPKEEIVGMPREVQITTTDPPRKEDTTVTDPQKIDQESDSHPNESASNDRFVYHQLSEENALPPVINIVEELRRINDLVARNSRPLTTTTTTTTQNPSEEEKVEEKVSSFENLLSKIILPSDTMKTSSEDPIPLSSTSTVWSSNSTSRNILSKNSSSSSNSDSTVSSTTEESQQQQSTSDQTSSSSSTTSSKPEINEPDPYWWLPSGWAAAERTAAERPLLMRFWSALSGVSGSQTKV